MCKLAVRYPLGANCGQLPNWAAQADLGILRMLRNWCKSALLLNTATSYYVQERPRGALEGGDMGRHYSTRDFFRQMPNRLLARA
ncbi:MAG: hypothetical protein ABSG60_00580 [Terracidiphilus sp.]|jgi:hypothetical protein